MKVEVSWYEDSFQQWKGIFISLKELWMLSYILDEQLIIFAGNFIGHGWMSQQDNDPEHMAHEMAKE